MRPIVPESVRSVGKPERMPQTILWKQPGSRMREITGRNVQSVMKQKSGNIVRCCPTFRTININTGINVPTVAGQRLGRRVMMWKYPRMEVTENVWTVITVFDISRLRLF